MWHILCFPKTERSCLLLWKMSRWMRWSQRRWNDLIISFSFCLFRLQFILTEDFKPKISKFILIKIDRVLNWRRQREQGSLFWEDVRRVWIEVYDKRQEGKRFLFLFVFPAWVAVAVLRQSVAMSNETFLSRFGLTFSTLCSPGNS